MIPVSSFSCWSYRRDGVPVLAVARRLKARGKDVVELEIGDSPFPSTPHAKPAGIRAIEEDQTGYGPRSGLPEFREAAPKTVQAEFGIAADGRERRRRLGGEAVRAVFRRGRCSTPATASWSSARSSRPTCRTSQRRGAEPVPRAAARRRTSSAPTSPTIAHFLETDAAGEGDLPELAPQPDRRRRHGRRPGGDRRRGPRDGHGGLLRRAVLPHGLGGPAHEHPRRARDARPVRGRLHLQQVVQHERLADRLRGGDPARSWSDRQADQHARPRAARRSCSWPAGPPWSTTRPSATSTWPGSAARSSCWSTGLAQMRA